MHKKVPKKILPKHLGGELDEITVINGNMLNFKRKLLLKSLKFFIKEALIQHLKANEKLLMDYQNYGIDIEKAKAQNKNYASSNDATETVTGTFRKLNVD